MFGRHLAVSPFGIKILKFRVNFSDRYNKCRYILPVLPAHLSQRPCQHVNQWPGGSMDLSEEGKDYVIKYEPDIRPFKRF